MAESLRQKRCRFTAMVAELIVQARFMGFEPALNEAMRSDEQACINALGSGGRAALMEHLAKVELFQPLARALTNNAGSGIRNSLHELGLAVDLLLYRNGQYLTATEDYRLLGEWWETRAPDARWGGRFQDGNHFSLEHEGRR